MSLVLVGPRGAGKSASGRRVANRLGCAFVDLDDVIEAAAAESIPEIFARGGEALFRELEQRALASLEDREALVLATGGGVILRPENRQRLRSLGCVVWLEVSPEVAVQRLQSSHPRPALTQLSPLDEARAVAAARAPLYAEVCARTIQTDHLGIDEVCDELEHVWHSL